jgi:tRNA modification GTPase
MAGVVRDPLDGTPLDEVLYFFLRGPHTATGDDVAEVHGHGGPVVMGQLLAAVLRAGARPAEPGEFTYRAFANGRIDLTQAEAVMGLIGARSERAARVALSQMTGNLGAALEGYFKELSSVAAHIEAGLDFPDEDLPAAVSDALYQRLALLVQELKRLAASFAIGSRLKEGARIAIVGPPNAGKSSLFNCLLKEERAIVDSSPGTTRDVVTSHGVLAGIPVVYSDTAGLRDAASRVEKMGIEKSHQTAREADVIALVLDGAGPELESDIAHFAPLLEEMTSRKMVVLNKKDLPAWHGLDGIRKRFDVDCVGLSAVSGDGMETLLSVMGRLLAGDEREELNVLTTARQYRAVIETLEFVKNGASLLDEGGEPELVAAELKWALETLSALLGKSATEEMLSLLFSEFCIGK